MGFHIGYRAKHISLVSQLSVCGQLSMLVALSHSRMFGISKAIFRTVNVTFDRFLLVRNKRMLNN
jgi:hypothetical protein